MIGHSHNFQISGHGCQILPWSWHSRSFLTGISHGSPSRRETNSENHIWEGQNRATRKRRTPLVFTLHNTAGMSLTGGKAYSFMPARDALAHLSPERLGERGRTKGGIGSTPEMQRGPPLPRRIVPKSDPPYGSSASIPLTWVSVSTESPPLGSGPLGYGLLSGTKICLVPKEEAGAHACLECTTGSPPSDWCETPLPCCLSWRWHKSVPGMEESEWELDEPLSMPGKVLAWPDTPSRSSL